MYCYVLYCERYILGVCNVKGQALQAVGFRPFC